MHERQNVHVENEDIVGLSLDTYGDQLAVHEETHTVLMSGILPTVAQFEAIICCCLPKSCPSDFHQSHNVPPVPF